MQKLGVIDLGTNTFHLLIAEVQAGAIRPVFRERFFVKLAEEGIDRIGAAAFERGLQTMQSFREQLDKHEVKEYRAIGTAALRTAVNGAEFIRKVADQTGIRIELIDGQEEARFIHLGVRQAVAFADHPNMIMDIGGGSVEFIIADADKVFWAKSYPVGVAVLYHRFHHTEPILDAEVQALEAFLDDHFQDLRQALLKYQPKDLVGASGTFDVLENKLAAKQNGNLASTISIPGFHQLYNELIRMDQQQRLVAEGVPPTRADMIIVALILLKKVIEIQQPGHILVSTYAMKEGILAEML